MTPATSDQRKQRSNVGAWREIERARQLARSALASQERQRRLISRELHDNIAQVLVVATTHLEMAKRRARTPDLRRALSRVRTELDQTLDTVGDLARRLRVKTVDSDGLAVALAKHAQTFGRRARVALEVDIAAPSAGLLDGEQATNLFRIAQEALQNVEKHAEATEASLRLHDGDGTIRLEISDNGKSFAPGRAKRAEEDGHLGFTGMRERAAMLGGHLEVDAVPGNGTTVRAVIPLPTTNGKTTRKDQAV